MLKKLENESFWEKASLTSKKPRVLIDSEVLPNVLYAIGHDYAWQQGRLDSPSVEMHGDLNENNVLGAPDVEFMLIDFEKVHPGPPHYDLAFLYVRLCLKFVLERLEPDDDAVRLTADLADRFFGASDTPLHPFLKPLDLATETLLERLKLLAPDRPSQDGGQRKLGALALAMASTSLCYYEVNNLGRATNPSAKSKHFIAAKFLFLLACRLLRRSEILTDSWTKGEAFTFPSLASQTKESASAPANVETLPPLRIADRWIKFVYNLQSSPTWWETTPPGWRRFEHVELYRYFSKMQVRDPDCRAVTEEALVWRDGRDGALPLVFELDDQSLGAGLDARMRGLELVSCDLIPIRGGKGVRIGLTFRGRDEVSLGDHLALVSDRNPAKIPLERGSARASELAGRTLADLVRELEAGLSENRAPCLDLSRMPKTTRKLNERPLIFQCLLSAAWKDLYGSAALTRSIQLAVSCSPPGNPEYPKDPASIRILPPHPEAKGSALFALHPQYGALAWTDAGDEFSRSTRHRIFLEAQYLHWILAQLLTDGAHARRLTVLLEQPIRKDYFKRASDAIQGRQDQ